MTMVRRNTPLGELVTLRQAMDRLFEDSFVRPRTFGFGDDAVGRLPLDITNAPDALIVDAALPGIRPEDVDITVEDGTLSISAESHSEQQRKDGEALLSEIRHGSFSRTVTLPTGLEPDKATATFEHGVLHLTIPRSEAVKPRQIRISPTIDGTSTDGRSSATSEVDTGSTDADPGA
jgi:HSP20 family protein